MSAELYDAEMAGVLARPASPTEIAKAQRFLDAQPDRLVAVQSLAWSLLVSAEFLFNH